VARLAEPVGASRHEGPASGGGGQQRGDPVEVRDGEANDWSADGVIGIVTDSNAQLPPELVERYDVEVVPLTIIVEGKEFAEGVDLDADAFYDLFADGAAPSVATSQPSPGQFAAAYERSVAKGATEILSIHIGSAVSGTLNSARLVAGDAPVPVRLVDTNTSSFGIACCVWEAADAVRGGASIEEAAAVAETVGESVGNVFVVSALDLARAGGRVVVDEAATGDGIPVLSLDGGDLKVVATVHDVGAATEAMASYCTRPELGDRLRIAVGVADSDAGPLWQALEDRVAEHASVVEVVRYRIGPSVGVHTGPGTVGAFFWPVRS
jgi:DegV family protein with EDD domain